MINEVDAEEIKMDLEKFGEIIDNFLKENHVQMLIEMPEGTLEPIVKDNIGAGAVMKFYFLLNAISAVGKEMKKDMGISSDDTEEWENVVDGIMERVKNDLMASEANRRG